MSELHPELHNTGLESIDAATYARVQREEFINATLSNMYGDITSARQMAKIPGVGFYDATSNSYKTTSDNPSHGNVSHVITPESMQRISLTINGETEYFKRIANIDGEHGTKAGVKAAAWIGTDKNGNELRDVAGKQEIRFTYAGLAGQMNEGPTLMTDIKGQLDAQAGEGAKFAGNVISSRGGSNNISSIKIGAHSLGDMPLMATDQVAQLEGIPVKSKMLLEPVAATQARDTIRQDIRNTHNDYSQSLLAAAGLSGTADSNETKAKLAATGARLEDNTLTIRTIHQEADGTWLGSRVSNLIPNMAPDGMLGGNGSLPVGFAHEYVRDLAFETGENAAKLKSALDSALHGAEERFPVATPALEIAAHATDARLAEAKALLQHSSHIPSNLENPLKGTLGRAMYEVVDWKHDGSYGNHSPFQSLDSTHRIMNIDDGIAHNAPLLQVENIRHTLNAANVTHSGQGASNAALPSSQASKERTGPS